MIYTCRFCEWQSIYPYKLKEHVEENHELILKKITAKENGNELAIETEKLIKSGIWVCDNKGFLKPTIIAIQNKCRFCGSKFKAADKFNKHMETDHQDQEVEIEARSVGDGFVATIEELERKKISLK